MFTLVPFYLVLSSCILYHRTHKGPVQKYLVSKCKWVTIFLLQLSSCHTLTATPSSLRRRKWLFPDIRNDLCTREEHLCVCAGQPWGFYFSSTSCTASEIRLFLTLTLGRRKQVLVGNSKSALPLNSTMLPWTRQNSQFNHIMLTLMETSV